MASGPQVLQFPFTGGIDEGTRDEVLEPGGWPTLENVRQDARGALYKRDGFGDPLSRTRADGTTGSQAHKLFGVGRRAARVTENGGQYQLENYDSISGRWVPERGRLPPCTTRVLDTPGMGATSYITGCAATSNGYLGVTWTALGSQFYAHAAVFNPVSGVVVSPPIQVGSGLTTSATNANAQIVAVGAVLFLVRHDNSAGIKAWKLDTTSASTIATGWVSMTDLVSDLGSPREFSVCSLGASAALIYTNNTGGTDRVSLLRFDDTGVIETTTIGTSSTTAKYVDVAGRATGSLWAAWDESAIVNVQGYDPTDLTTITSTVGPVLDPGGGTYNGIYLVDSPTAGAGRVLGYQGTSVPLALQQASWTTVAGAVTGGTLTTILGALPVSKPFEYGARYFIQMMNVAVFNFSSLGLVETQPLVDFTDDVAWFRPAATPFAGIGSLPFTDKSRAAIIGSKVYMTWPVKRSAGGDGGHVVELDFASTARWRGVAVGGTLHIAGATPYTDDGARVCEEGFIHSPPKPQLTNSGTGITGTFRYIATYEEIDAQGNWHQSGISVPSDAITVTDKTITVETFPLVITDRVNPAAAQSSTLRVALWRTLTGGEAPYYRLTTLANDTSQLVSYDDTTADATLSANAKLYEQPGVTGTVQDHRPPPSFIDVVEHLGLVVGLTEEEVWCSAQPVYGEATWWSPIFTQPFRDGTALASQDGLIYAFTRTRVFALPCEPPSDNGAVGGLGAPQMLAADVGCIDARSVVVTALGVFFQSERGIEILARSRSVTWVGESVADTLRSFPVITSARLDAVDSLVYFECAAAESGGLVTGTGRTLVYDLTLQTWTSIDRRTDSAGGADPPAQDACVVYDGTNYRYSWLGADGRVYTQDRATHLDSGQWVTMRAVSPWVKASGLQGEQHVNRVLALAKRATDHDVTLSIAYDYASTYADERLYAADELADLVDAIPNQQLEHPMGDDARGQAVRVKLEDATPSSGTVGTGQGATWIGLAFEVVPQPGTHPLPDKAR